MEERIVNLEIKLAYQEDLLAQLNETLIAQQKEIDLLNRKNKLLNEKVKELEDKESGERPSRKPPHY